MKNDLSLRSMALDSGLSGYPHDSVFTTESESSVETGIECPGKIRRQ